MRLEALRCSTPVTACTHSTELGVATCDDILLLEDAEVEAAKRDLKPIAKKRLGLAVAACHEAKKVAAKHSKAQSRGSVAQFLGKLKLE